MISHVENNSETKAEADSQPAKSGTLAANQESVGSNGDQGGKDDMSAVEIPLDQIWAFQLPGRETYWDWIGSGSKSRRQ